jgi:hypothetical protein
MNTYDKKELERLILDENKSYSEIGKIFNITGSAIKKAALRFGISLPKRRIINPNETFNKGKLFIKYEKGRCKNCDVEIVLYPERSNEFCSHECHSEYEYHQYIKRWKNGEENGIVAEFLTSTYIKKYFFEKNNNKCEKCGWGEKNKYTNKVPLQLHHNNGDSLNNDEENLQLLCPNCHSLTQNFGSRNKNATKGRSEYFGRKKRV